MWSKVYLGFESLDTLLSGDDIEDFLNFLIDEPEWKGALQIVVTYDPNPLLEETEEEDENSG